jgi:hypothetical protein
MVTEAIDYFESQIGISSPPPLGLSLGLAEARTRTGLIPTEASEADLASSFQYQPKESILPLVLKVIRLLESTKSDEMLRTALLTLYPKVQEFISSKPETRWSKTEHQNRMLSQLVDQYLFYPAAISSDSDLQSDEALPIIRTSGRDNRDIFLLIYENVAISV